MDLYGPAAGRHHDTYMLRLSNINTRIAALQQGAPVQYKMYADKGYVNLSHLVAAYHGIHVTPAQIQINGIMTLVRISVEWCFGKISECQRYLAFPRLQQLQLQPVGKYYRVGALLMNAHTCLYGSFTGAEFALQAPKLGNYFDCEDLMVV